MHLLPKYIKYKIASELALADLFNLRLTSKDNYQMYRSDDFWAYKLKMTTLEWQNRVDSSGDLYSLCHDRPFYRGLKSVYRYRSSSPVIAYIDITGNLYLANMYASVYDIRIFGRLIRKIWTRIELDYVVEDFIYMSPDHMLILTQNHELHIIFNHSTEPNTVILPAVKKIDIISLGFNKNKAYFVTDQDQLHVVEGQQYRRIATNVTHVLRAIHCSDDDCIDLLYYVVCSTAYSAELWCYHSENMTSVLKHEFDFITSISHRRDTLYINDVGYSDIGLGLVKNGKVLKQKGLVQNNHFYIRDDINQTLKRIDSNGVINHIDSGVSKVFLDDCSIFYIKKPTRLPQT